MDNEPACYVEVTCTDCGRILAQGAVWEKTYPGFSHIEPCHGSRLSWRVKEV